MANTTEIYPIVRNDADTGWLVKAHIHSKEFLDVDYGHSRQNSYVEANSHSENAIIKGKRGAAIERNYSIVNKVNKNGTIDKLIKITRPKGGYKTFKAPLKNNGQDYDVEAAIQAACNWFMKERALCLDDIISKNLESKKARKSARHSFLFGDPTLGLKKTSGN